MAGQSHGATAPRRVCPAEGTPELIKNKTAGPAAQAGLDSPPLEQLPSFYFQEFRDNFAVNVYREHMISIKFGRPRSVSFEVY